MERGWINGGDPCDPKDVRTLPGIVAGKGLGQWKLPRRGYYIGVDDTEVRKLHKLPHIGTPQAEWYRVSGFPGCEPASYKTNCAKAMRGKPFIPETFILPQERKELEAAALRDKRNKVKSMWIGKPKNNWSGRGITVYPSGHKFFKASLE